MNLAKVSANGQITVPVEIRRSLNLKEGDKVLFFQRENGDVVIDNASATALYKVQNAMLNAAEEAGLYDEDDVQALVDKLRNKKC